jgi:hypothetical protein
MFLYATSKIKTTAIMKDAILAGRSGFDAELKTTAKKYVIHESTSVPARYEAGKNIKEGLTSLSLRINRKRCSQYGSSNVIKPAPSRKEITIYRIAGIN